MVEFKMPSHEDLNLMKLKAYQFGKDGDMIPIELWDGDGWHSMFDWFKEDFANNNEDIAWEYLAYFIQQTLCGREE